MQEELKKQSFKIPNIMIRQTFSSIFKRVYWQQINQKQPHFFLLIQTSILKFLLFNQEAFQKLFVKFYNNHNHLYHWYLLSSDRHEQIKKYVFSNLLKKPIQEYRSKMKENIILNSKNNKQISKINFDAQKYCTRAPPQSQKRLLLKEIQNLGNLNQEEKQKFQQLFNQDYHQLFMKTFQACQGSKYIFYDFTKHMKGFNQRVKYNQFIRSKTRNANRSMAFDSFYQRSKKNQTVSQIQNNSMKFQHSSYHYQKECEFTKENIAYSKYQLVPIGNFCQKRKNIQSKNFKRSQLVLKKLPSQFGKPKFLNLNKEDIKN